MKSLILVSASALLMAVAARPAQSSRTIRGVIVGVAPDGKGLSVRAPMSDGEWVQRIFYVDPLTRIRSGGQAVTLDEAAAAGGTAMVTYLRIDGRNVARLVELPGEVGPDPSPVGERIDKLEDRERYEESVGITLEVLEEEIQELEHSSETGGGAELARSRALAAELRDKLRDAEAKLDSLISIRSEIAWEGARRDLQAAMADLSEALRRARSEITGR